MTLIPATDLRHRDADGTLSTGTRCPACGATGHLLLREPATSQQPAALQQQCSCSDCGFCWTNILELRCWVPGWVAWEGVDWTAAEKAETQRKTI